MRSKGEIDLKKFLKKYFVWIVFVVAIMIIPATNSKYILQKSASLELKPDQYNLIVNRSVTAISSANSDIEFNIQNNNQYPIKIEIRYKGNVVANGITVPDRNNYIGKFKIPQNVYDEVLRNNGADMDIKVVSPYSAEYKNMIRVDVPQSYLASRSLGGNFFGNTFDLTKIAKISFSDQGTTPPPGVVGSFDVSEGKKGNVIAWYTKNATDPSKYDFVISANGKVKIRNSENMFSQLTNLTDVDFTNFDLSGNWSLRNMFYNTKSLRNINWGGIDTSSITATSQCFYGSGIQNLDLSSLNLSALRDASNMFSEATNLETLNMAGTNTVSLENMVGMFKNTRSLKNFNPSDLNVSNVTSMSYSFSGTGGKTDYDFSSWNVSKVKDFGYMFSNAKNIKNINFTGWDVSNADRFSYMFEKMDDIETIDVSSFHPIKVRDTIGMFSNNKNLKKIIFNNFQTVDKVYKIFC